MSRAYGANAQLLGRFENTYGTTPTGNFIKLPFVSCDLGSQQGLIASDVLGQGRDPAAPARDVINVDGNITVPVDLRNFGHWLKALLGAPVTTGTGPYDHTFISGTQTLPSLSLEVGMPELPVFFMNAGIVLNSMQMTFARSGLANAVLNAIAQGETKDTVSAGGTPTQAAFKRFSQFQGAIKKDGVALANVTGSKFTYSNNLEKVEVIRADGKIDGVDPTIASLTGDIDVRFAATSLIDAATDGDPIALEFSYAIDADNALVFTVPEVYLPKPKLAVNGPGGVQATFNWQAAKPVAAPMLTVVLSNDVASYA